MAEFIKTKEKTARKPHKCDMCGKIIECGHKYMHRSVKKNGVFSTRRFCIVCSKGEEK